MAEKEVEQLCIKTQALIDNLDEQDSKYEEIFYNTEPETVTVNLKDYETGEDKPVTVDSFKKIEDDTNTFIDENIPKRPVVTLTNNGILTFSNPMEVPCFIDELLLANYKNCKIEGDTLIVDNATVEGDTLILS
jgi:hypothetical protein